LKYSYYILQNIEVTLTKNSVYIFLYNFWQYIIPAAVLLKSRVTRECLPTYYDPHFLVISAAERKYCVRPV